MIRQKTTLVLGAGASQPYDFPLGRDLVGIILDDLDAMDANNRTYLNVALQERFEIRSIRGFRDALRGSAQPSIDRFLEFRPEFVDVGRLAIASALLPQQRKLAEDGSLWRAQELRWYEYLLSSLSQIPDGLLSIVTFNYDNSVELFLRSTLRHTLGDPGRAEEMLTSIPIVHVHGELGTTSRTPDEAAQGIRIVHEAETQSEAFQQARDLIADAEIVAFIGFSYLPDNVKRLRLNTKGFAHVAANNDRLLGSAYGLGRDERRRAEKLFNGGMRLDLSSNDALQFLQDSPVFD